MNLMSMIAQLTRRVQAIQPAHRVRGLTRLSGLLNSWLPPYAGIVRLPDGTCFHVDSRDPAERGLLFTGTFQVPYTHWLRQHVKPGDHCLDIGANLGFYTVHLADWAKPAGRVAAFEANPVVRQRLQQNVQLNQQTMVEVVPKAIHNQIGVAEFYIASNRGKSSLRPDQVTAIETLNVETTTIDAFIEQAQWPRLNVIKSDIEGNDCFALLGAVNTLNRFHPIIVFEFWFNTPAEVAQACFEMLRNAGYRLRVLTAAGQEIPFDPQNPGTKRHVDVIAIPPR